VENALLLAVDNTIRFLRLAAIELRRLAERAPDISAELHHVADQLEADVADLERASGSRRRDANIQ
jgi:hypothetical protein